MPIYCQNCGSLNEISSAFCTNCGVRVDKVEELQSSVVAPASSVLTSRDFGATNTLPPVQFQQSPITAPQVRPRVSTLLPIACAVCLLAGSAISLGLREFGALDVVLGSKISEDSAAEQASSEFNRGLSEGRTEGFNDGKDIGYSEGNEDGYQRGYEEGSTSGGSAGYESGYSAGVDAGKELGFIDGQKDGYDDGLRAGIDKGYSQGYSDGCENVFEQANYAGAVIGYSPSNNRIGTRYVVRDDVC